MSTVRYFGKVGNDDPKVFVERDGKITPLPIRLDLVGHSPDGHFWGYNGSGPAQCAAALLADYFSEGKNPLYRRVCGAWTPLDQEPNHFALDFYQEFKSDVIANFDMKSDWSLEGEDIKLAVLEISASRRARATAYDEAQVALDKLNG